MLLPAHAHDPLQNDLLSTTLITTEPCDTHVPAQALASLHLCSPLHEPAYLTATSYFLPDNTSSQVDPTAAYPPYTQPPDAHTATHAPGPACIGLDYPLPERMRIRARTTPTSLPALSTMSAYSMHASTTGAYSMHSSLQGAWQRPALRPRRLASATLSLLVLSLTSAQASAACVQAADTRDINARIDVLPAVLYSPSVASVMARQIVDGSSGSGQASLSSTGSASQPLSSAQAGGTTPSAPGSTSDFASSSPPSTSASPTASWSAPTTDPPSTTSDPRSTMPSATAPSGSQPRQTSGPSSESQQQSSTSQASSVGAITSTGSPSASVVTSLPSLSLSDPFSRGAGTGSAGTSTSEWLSLSFSFSSASAGASTSVSSGSRSSSVSTPVGSSGSSSVTSDSSSTPGSYSSSSSSRQSSSASRASSSASWSSSSFVSLWTPATTPTAVLTDSSTFSLSNTAVSFPVLTTRTATMYATTDSTTTVHSATTETQRYTETTVTETSVWTVTYTSHGHTSVTVFSSVVISGSLIPEANSGKVLLAQNHGALAGVIVGSLALLSFLAVLLVIALRRHRKHKAVESATAAALADGGRRRPTNMLADEDEDLPPTPTGGMAHVGAPATLASGVVYGRLNGSGSAFGHLTRLSEQSALADLALGSNYYAGAFAAEADSSDEVPAHGSSGEDGYTPSSSGGDHLSAVPLLGTRASGSGLRARSSSGIDPASWLSGKDATYTAVPLSASASSNVLAPNSAGVHPVGSLDPFADPVPQPHPYNNPALIDGEFVDEATGVAMSQRKSWDEFGAVPGASGSSNGHGAHSQSACYHSGRSTHALASGPASSSGHGHRERDDGRSSDGHALSSTGHGDTATRRSSLLPTNPGAPPTAYRAPPPESGEDGGGGQAKGRRLSFLGSVRRPWKRRASMSDASAEYVDARSSFPPGSSSDARTSQYTDARLSAASSGGGGGVPMRSVTISPATSQQALNVLNQASVLPAAGVGGEGTFGRATAVTGAGTGRTMRRSQAPTLPSGSIPPPPDIQGQSRAYPHPYTQYPAPASEHGQGMLPPTAFGYAHHAPYVESGAVDLHPWRGLAGLVGAPDVPSPAPTEASSAGAPEGLLDPHRLGAHAAGMWSDGAISFRDEVDYSRPIGGLVNRRQQSVTTLRTTSTRQRVYEDEDSRSHLDDIGHGEEDEEDISCLRGAVF